MRSRDRNDEEFEQDRVAYIAFYSSAIAGFKPQKTKYSSPEAYAREVNEFAEAVATEALAHYRAAEAAGFPGELEDYSDDSASDDEDEDDDDERPRRRRA
jgi:hypothetical protein